MSEKIEQEVFELIKKSNFKECNSKVSKLLNQFPNSSYLQILDMYAKYKQSPGKFDYDKTLGSTYGLQGKNITGDARALALLHKMFIELEKFPEALNVYERAMFKYPSFDIALFWFDRSLKDYNYRHMAKASLQLAKYCPVIKEGTSIEKRDYYFWHALSIFALYKFNYDTITDQESKVLPALAYKSLSEAKPLLSTQEAIAFCMVCEGLFPNDKSISEEIINASLPFLETSVDLYLKNFLLNHLQKTEDYQRLYECCEKIMHKLDDFGVIEKYILAAEKLSKPKIETLSHIRDIVGDSRNTRLASLQADWTFDKQISKDSISFYLAKFHAKQCSPSDLSSYMDKMDIELVKSIFHAFDDNSVLHDSNALKLGWSDKDALTLYTKHRGTLDTKATTEYSTCSAFILDLLGKRMALKNPNLKDIVFSLTVLENYQLRDQYNYDIQVWIIALYMYLGCVPLAYSHYLDLKVKNVQIDSMDHLIYTRFSSLFPQKQHDYIKTMEASRNAFYGNSFAHLPQFERVSFERKAYSKIPGIMEFRSRVERSNLRWIKLCESLQLARLCNDKRGPLLEELHNGWKALTMTCEKEKFSDNRDWSLFGQTYTKESLPAPLQYLSVDEVWIKVHCIKEFMIESIPMASKIQHIEDFLKETDLQTALTSLTNVEKWSFQVFHSIYESKDDELLQLLNAIPSATETQPSWKISHTQSVSLATLKTVDGFKRIKDARIKKIIKSKIAEIRDNCDSIFNTYRLKIKDAVDEMSSASDEAKILKQLGFATINSETITNCILSVQKTIRNL